MRDPNQFVRSEVRKQEAISRYSHKGNQTRLRDGFIFRFYGTDGRWLKKMIVPRKLSLFGNKRGISVLPPPSTWCSYRKPTLKNEKKRLTENKPTVSRTVAKSSVVSSIKIVHFKWPINPFIWHIWRTVGLFCISKQMYLPLVHQTGQLRIGESFGKGMQGIVEAIAYATRLATRWGGGGGTEGSQDTGINSRVETTKRSQSGP